MFNDFVMTSFFASADFYADPDLVLKLVTRQDLTEQDRQKLLTSQNMSRQAVWTIQTADVKVGLC